MTPPSGLIRRLAFGLVVVLVVLGAAFGSSSKAFSYARLFLFHEFFVLILLGLYVLRPVIFVPLGGLHLLAGYVYGGVLGASIALVGTVLTSMPVYAAGKYFQPTSGIGGWLAKRGASSFSVTGDLRGILAASLSPVPADVVSYAAGIGGIRPRIFVVGLVAGEVPWVVAYVLVGTTMTSLSAGAVTDRVGIVIALVALSLLVVARPAWVALRNQ